MSEKNIFSVKLKELRSSLNMTQVQFASYVGTNQVTLSAYETGSTNPSLEIVKEIAIKCNVSIDWLCGLSNKKSLGDKITTYADAFRMLINLCSTKYKNGKSNILFPSQFENRDNGDMLFIVSEDINFTKFFTEWTKMYHLYSEKTIDEELLNMWLAKELPNYERELNRYPF